MKEEISINITMDELTNIIVLVESQLREQSKQGEQTKDLVMLLAKLYDIQETKRLALY